MTIPNQDDTASMAKYYLNECGFSAKVIANRMGITVDEVDNLLTRRKRKSPRRIPRPNRRRHLAEDEKAHFIALFNDGTTIAKLGKVFRTSYSKVIQWCKELNLSRENSKLPTQEEFAEFYNDRTIPLAKIAEHFKISPMTVSRLRNRFGLPPRQIHRRGRHE